MSVKRRRRIKLGDVYAIPLPDGKFAYGRRFKDAAIAIYKLLYNFIRVNFHIRNNFIKIKAIF
ncbi:hypothetical protein [Paenibacillus terrigena]|uniref:hypothetical protein n=1 Tax=Paenibacillus terrigena TaxID=369333 RepID=UPI00037ACED9|nr:hypothetical protein [Paenibacillus terrigena]